MIHRYIIEATDEVKGFEKAIERLDREWGIEELEPCEDAISRAEVHDLLATWLSDYLTDETREALETINGKIGDMQPVIPKAEPCEDCISREAIYEALSEWDEQDVYLPYHFKELVAELPSVTPWSDWIPVSEKLPEPLTAVLLTVRYKSTGHWTYQMGYWEDMLERWEKWLEAGTLEEEFEVVAWMELPEGYKEDDHE